VAVGWSIGRSVGWSVGRSVGRPAGRPVGRSVKTSVGRRVGRGGAALGFPPSREGSPHSTVHIPFFSESKFTVCLSWFRSATYCFSPRGLGSAVSIPFCVPPTRAPGPGRAGHPRTHAPAAGRRGSCPPPNDRLISQAHFTTRLRTLLRNLTIILLFHLLRLFFQVSF